MIRKLSISAIILFIIICSNNCSKNKKELEDIHGELQQLKKRVDVVYRELRLEDKNPDYKRRGVDYDALEGIVFPGNADKSKIRKYVVQIIAASEKQDSFGDEDPQIDLLAKVGEQNISVLIEAARYISFPCVYYVNKAICRLATERSRQLIADELRYNKDLIEAVLKNKWQEYVKNILKGELDRVNQSTIERDRYLPTEWIQGIALLKDPSTYGALKYYFVNGNNKYHTYKAIRDLPGIHVEAHIVEAWKKRNNIDEWNNTMLATIAVGYGEKDALDILFRSLKNEDYSYYYKKILNIIYEYIEAQGSNVKIIEWYNRNKSNIYFDPNLKKFRARS